MALSLSWHTHMEYWLTDWWFKIIQNWLHVFSNKWIDNQFNQSSMTNDPQWLDSWRLMTHEPWFDASFQAGLKSRELGQPFKNIIYNVVHHMHGSWHPDAIHQCEIRWSHLHGVGIVEVEFAWIRVWQRRLTVSDCQTVPSSILKLIPLPSWLPRTSKFLFRLRLIQNSNVKLQTWNNKHWI